MHDMIWALYKPRRRRGRGREDDDLPDVGKVLWQLSNDGRAKKRRRHELGFAHRDGGSRVYDDGMSCVAGRRKRLEREARRSRVVSGSLKVSDA